MSSRIGFDVTAALAQGGGIGRYTRELIHALLAVDSTNQYKLFSARPPTEIPVANPLPSAPNATHRPAPFDERWLYRVWYRLRLPLPVQGVTGPLDLFHSPDFVLPPVAGGIPALVTVHDLSFVHYPHTFVPRLVDYLNSVVPWSIGRATHVLADSESTRDDLRAVWAVPADKITVLYSGVNERFRRVEQPGELAAVRARSGLGEWPFVLAVGTVQPRKNYGMLVRAFAPLTETLPHHLVIAGGQGWLADDLFREVEKLGLEERVHFTGFVPDDDLPALYSAADLLAFPSLYEGFGLPLLEAMGCGTAVVSSDRSSLPEVIGPEPGAGLLLPPDDESAWTEGMRALLTDRELRHRFVQRGYARIRSFTWERAARQLLEIYAALLQQR